MISCCHVELMKAWAKAKTGLWLLTQSCARESKGRYEILHDGHCYGCFDDVYEMGMSVVYIRR